MELKLVSVLVSMTIPDITGSNVRGLNIKIPHFGLDAEHNESGFSCSDSRSSQIVRSVNCVTHRNGANKKMQMDF